MNKCGACLQEHWVNEGTVNTPSSYCINVLSLRITDLENKIKRDYEEKIKLTENIVQLRGDLAITIGALKEISYRAHYPLCDAATGINDKKCICVNGVARKCLEEIGHNI